jgi:WhiB family redox-sensing transcriptional regulator
MVLPASFLQLLAEQRPAWTKDALCPEYPHVSFFPQRGESSGEAKAICRRCLVQEECLAYALTTHSTATDHGVWGGLSARERRQLRRITT